MSALLSVIAGCLHPAVSAPATGISVVQVGSSYRPAGSVITTSLASNPAAGNRLVYFVVVANGGTITAPSGFTPAGSYGNYGATIYWFTKVADGSEKTVSASGSTLSYSAIYLETTPASGIEFGAGALPASGTTSVDIPSATPSVNNTLALALITHSGVAGDMTASAPWATLASQIGTSSGARSLALASQPQITAAAVSGSWSVAAVSGAIVTATVFLKP